MSGIPFDVTPSAKKGVRRPFAPSLDRRDSSKGYTPANIRVVCVAVNLAMNEWGHTVLLKLAAGIFHSGAMGRQAKKAEAPVVLPHDVKLYRGKKRTRYLARVRESGVEKHLGSFSTVEEALDARLTWARANSSRKVIREIFEYTRAPELMNEIKAMQV